MCPLISSIVKVMAWKLDRPINYISTRNSTEGLPPSIILIGMKKHHKPKLQCSTRCKVCSSNIFHLKSFRGQNIPYMYGENKLQSQGHLETISLYTGLSTHACMQPICCLLLPTLSWLNHRSMSSTRHLFSCSTSRHLPVSSSSGASHIWGHFDVIGYLRVTISHLIIAGLMKSTVDMLGGYVYFLIYHAIETCFKTTSGGYLDFFNSLQGKIIGFVAEG